MGSFISRDKHKLLEEVTIMPKPNLYHVVIAGSSNVGKSYIMEQITGGPFNHVTMPIGNNLMQLHECSEDIDTSLVNITKVFILVFAENNRLSWHRTMTLYNKLQDHCDVDAHFIVVSTNFHQETNRISDVDMDQMFNAMIHPHYIELNNDGIDSLMYRLEYFLG